MAVAKDIGCRLSGDPRMRYWKPAAALAGLVSGYHLYAVETPAGTRHRDVFQPAWANLRIVLSPGTRWRVKVGEKEWTKVRGCALFGPSSTVTWSESGNGIVVGAGLTALGWSRLAAVPAATWANWVGDCAGAIWADVRSLRELLCAVERDEALPALLDSFLLGAMGGPTRRDAPILRVQQALLAAGMRTVGELSERVGSTARSLERLAASAFGFPPKLLLRRARFLRSLHAIREADPAERAAALDYGYTDYSHFVRDAHEFLGMSPQAFLKLDNPLFVESTRLRSKVLGAPAQALGTG